MTRKACSLWLLSCLIAGVILAADPVSLAPTGAQVDSPSIPAERLAVRSENGDSIPFADLIGADGRAVCFAFLHHACPLAQEYGPVLGEMAVAFADEGIRFVGVVCECDDSGDIEEYRKTYGITFPIYTDTGFHLAEALDATITPEVVLVDHDRRIRYAGRIDDRYKIRGVMSPGDPDHELRAAIRDLVAGREIGVPRTEAVGCPLDRPERPKPLASPDTMTDKAIVTYHKDVLPFLHTQCQRCHSPGQAGPFDLLTYDDAYEWVSIALEEIEARRMPPGQIESDLEFTGPKPPTSGEIAMLREWIADGKPAGNAAATIAGSPCSVAQASGVRL